MAKMTIMEVLKKIKHVDRKIEKGKQRIAKWCSFFDIESHNGQALYDTEKLIQSVNDLIALRSRYRHALHQANIDCKVEYNGKEVTIDELLVLRTYTLPAKLETLALLRRKEKGYNELRYLSEDERKAVKVITQFDPLARDKAIDDIENEMAELDKLLDDTNIISETELDR
jgi:hypothetical protein